MRFGKLSITAIYILVVLLVLSVLSATATTYAKCGCRPCGTTRYVDLDTGKYIYQFGEEVEFIFSNPKDYHLEFTRVYILQLHSYTGGVPVVDTIFEYEFPNTISPGTRWTLTWDQTDSQRYQVTPGRFMLVIETRYCGIYRAIFRIAKPCCYQYDSCCCCECYPCDP